MNVGFALCLVFIGFVFSLMTIADLVRDNCELEDKVNNLSRERSTIKYAENKIDTVKVVQFDDRAKAKEFSRIMKLTNLKD